MRYEIQVRNAGEDWQHWLYCDCYVDARQWVDECSVTYYEEARVGNPQTGEETPVPSWWTFDDDED